MNTTAVRRAAGLETSDADRLRDDLGQLRHDLERLAENVAAAASRHARSSAAAAGSELLEAQQRTLAIGRNVGREVKARPLTVATVASALGLLALAACIWRRG